MGSRGKQAKASGAFAYGALDDLEAYIEEQERIAEEAARAVELKVYLEEEEAARAAYLESHPPPEPERPPRSEEEAAATAQLLQARLEEAKAALAKAELELANANQPEALRLARSAWSLLDEVDDPAETAEGEAQALRLIVKAHVAEEDFELALELASEQLRYFRHSRFVEAEIVATVAIAEASLAMESPKASERAARAALANARRLQDEALVAQGLEALARAHLQLGRPLHISSALEEAREAVAIRQRSGEGREEAAALLLVSRALSLGQESEEAFNCAGHSGEVSRRLGCRRGEAAAWREASALLSAAGRLGESLEAAQEAAKLADGGDAPGEIASQQAVAAAQQQLGMLEDALEALEVGLSLAQELEDRRHIREVLDAMIRIHLGRGTVDEALRLAQEELQQASTSGSVRRSLDAFQRLVGLHLSLDRPGEALRVANGAVEALGPSGDKRAVAKALKLVAEAQAAGGHHKQALAVIVTARGHLKSSGGVGDMAALWQFTFALHTDLGDNEQALKSRLEEQKVYRLASWKDEEAAAALSVAELMLPLRGPEEAVGAARDALKLFEDLDDKQGKADALLRLAQLQVLAGQADEAAGNVLSARRLFQSFSDSRGEADALLVFADAYFQKGQGAQAQRLVRDALAVCRSAGDEGHERHVLQALASMQAALVQRRAEGGQAPEKDTIQEALKTCRSLMELCEAAGDEAGQAAASVLLSNVHCVNLDAQDALRTAEEALRLAGEPGEAATAGPAKLALAQAHLLLGDGSAARRAAEEAVSLLKEVSDGHGVDKATQIVLLAHTATRKVVVPSISTSIGARSWTPISKAGQQEQAAAPPTGGSAPNHVSPSRYGRQPRAAEPGQTAASGGTPQATGKADGAKVKAKPRKSAAGPAGVRSILLVVRPDWSATQLELVQERLAKIGIESMAELFSRLRTQGPQTVNDCLSGAGFPELEMETLQGLKEVACRGMAEHE